MLEDEVDEKYYLSDKLLACFMSNGTGKYPRRERFLQNINKENKDVANTIITTEGNKPTCNFIKEKNINKSLQEILEKNEIPDGINMIDSYNRNVRNDEISGTITTRVDASNNTYLAIKNATKKGYLEATDGDGIDLTQPNSKTRRGRVQKDSIQTLTTQNNLGVCVIGGIGEKKSNGGTQWYQQDRIYDNNISPTLTSTANPYYPDNQLRIRKLTPCECYMLMGFDKEDYIKASQVNSNAQLYKQAGNSIVVQCLEAILKNLL